MAKIGFKYAAWAKVATEPTGALPTYDTGKVIGKAISSNLAISNAEGSLYADNVKVEDVSEFSSATLTMEVDNITLQNQAEMYGADFVNDEMQNGGADNAPYGGFGGVQVLSVNNVRKYRAYYFPKCKAIVPDESDNTKGASISFGTQPLQLNIAEPNSGKWRYIKEFTTEAAALAYVDAKLGVAQWHEIDVQAQGLASGKTVSPVGVSYVAAAGTFVLNITGTPAALYDNGAESKASIAAGKYTLTNVAAAHKIAVIF